MDEKGDAETNTEAKEISENLCSEDNEEEENSQLKEDLMNRIQSLWDLMSSLKEQLREEKELWRKEIDELCKLQYEENMKKEINIDQSVLSSTEPLDISSPTDKKSQTFLNETAMTVYEQHLVRYQDAYGSLSLHADKRQQIRRQLAAHSYKRKLMEVERMCNLELARVRQTASYLEPLNKIASEWNLPQSGRNNNAKFLSMRDLHYTENCTSIPQCSSPETLPQQPLPPEYNLNMNPHYMSQLQASNCDMEMLQKAETGFTSISQDITDNTSDQNQSEMCSQYCNCEDLPMHMQNKIWTN